MSIDHLTDEEVAASAKQGNTAAVATLYDRHLDLLFRFVCRHLDHREDAEDVTSDIMVRMVDTLPRYREDAKFKTWLYAIARHVIADYWRRRYKLPTSLLPDDIASAANDAPPTVDEDAIFQDQRRRAKAVLDALPENYRQVIENRFYQQRTLLETAEAMAISVDNAKVLQHRALKKAAEISKTIL